jgi:hypothetical protein
LFSLGARASCPQPICFPWERGHPARDQFVFPGSAGILPATNLFLSFPSPALNIYYLLSVIYYLAATGGTASA